MRVAVADTFIAAQRKLDPSQLRAVQDAVGRLLEGGPQQVRLHRLEGVPHSAFDVPRGAMRVIALEEADTVLLLHVDAHDDAYAWAKRHRVVRVGRVMRVVETERAAEAAAEPASEATPPGPLTALRARDLARLEIGHELAEWLRAIPSEDALVDLASRLEPALADALVSLAAHPEDLQTVLHELEAARARAPEGPSSLEEILRDPRNAARFWVPPPGEEALARALRGDFESWQIFLHPSQERLVRKRANGPVKVTGGPGTGKTVVALHRARHLLEAVFADDPRPVLLTAFSRPLVAEMKRTFARLVGDDAALLDRARFATATQVAQDILRDAGHRATFLTAEELEPAWARALAADTLGRDRAFYERERERVLVAHGAWTDRAYLRAPRRGLGTRLGGAQRVAAWKVLAAFEAALDDLGGADDAGLARRARALVEADPARRPYAAVVCDELQDLAPESARLLAALASDADGAPRPDALFLVGDGYQRIFRQPIPLTRCHIDVRGRSHHLQLNYRTTEGLRAAAVRVIEGQPVDELDDAKDAEDLAPGHARYRSLRPGPGPEREAVASEAEAIEALAARLAEDAPRTLVLTRGQARLDRVSAALTARGVDHLRLRGGEAEGDGEARVVLATMHRAKGLEGARVIILDDGPPRRPPELDAEEWSRRQASLTYVAITRARDSCVIVQMRG